MKPVFRDGDKEYPLEITNTQLSEDGKSIIVTVKVTQEVLDLVKVGDSAYASFSLPDSA
jgi:hypothetical protein